MKLYTYIDNSNLFIEGQRLSAVQKRYAVDIRDANARRVFDFQWNIDYGKLHDFLCSKGDHLVFAKLWGSIPPNDSFWDQIRARGFDVKTFERGASGNEKKVDVAIAHQITKDVYSGVIKKEESIITLVAGDKDFVPVATDLVNEGFTFHVAFWSHAARELKESASYFVSLDSQLAVIQGPGPTLT